MQFRFFNNYKKVNKKTKINFIVWFIVFIIVFFGMVISSVFLSINYHDSYDYVGKHFAEGGMFADKLYTNSKDIMLGHDPITYGELYNDIGHQSFTWFYITTLHPLSLIPYIFLPISAVLFLVSSCCLFFTYRKISPPIKREKKSKKEVKCR